MKKEEIRKDSPVITQINRINTQLHSPLGIFNTLNTFQSNWQFCMLSQPGYIAPIQFWVDESSY